MDPGWEICKDSWLEFLNRPRLGDPEGSLVRLLGTSPGWGNQKGFWLESMKVRCSGEQMEMWSGSPK